MAEPDEVLDPDGDILIISRCQMGTFAVCHSWDTFNKRSSGVNNKNLIRSPLERRMKASSKHLTLASQRFRRMINNAWPDLNTIHEDGLIHWDTEVVDIEAFMVVMNIIHGRNRKVPQTIDLEMLAKISVVVDDLQCYEAVEVFSRVWIDKLKASIPAVFSRDLILWILISVVFYQLRIFRTCTRVAILQSMAPIPTLELPIRNRVVEMIDNQRQELLGRITASLNNLIDRLRDDDTPCSFECNSILLGALIKQMHKNRLFHPQPSKPYIGLSVSKTIRAVRTFQSPLWFSDRSPRPCREDGKTGIKTKKMRVENKGPYSGISMVMPEPEPKPHGCEFHALLLDLDSFEDGIKGLDLGSDLGYGQDGCVK